MKIAILGASSQIAKDLIISFHEKTDFDCFLFSRNTSKVNANFNKEHNNIKYENLLFDSFSTNDKYDLIINFVSIVNPNFAEMNESVIFEVAEKYDNIALNYLKEHPQTKYIFLSSGAVYGDSFDKPIDKSTLAKFDINSLKSKDWYSLSKLYLEAKHRSMQHFSIIDIRVFNYFSSSQNLTENYLIIDIVNSLLNKEVLITSSDNIIRDYITPPDFFNLIQKIITFGQLNVAFDCYTKAPVNKLELLTVLEREFSLTYNIKESTGKLDAGKLKLNYFSKNKLAEAIGYFPEYSSIEGVLKELNILFASKV
jgi:nucleoside-diphosphate-sugar epimerase